MDLILVLCINLLNNKNLNNQLFNIMILEQIYLMIKSIKLIFIL